MKIVLMNYAVLILLAGCGLVQKPSESNASKVARLIDQATVDAHAQAYAFDELQNMGDSAVPYLIRHLDDMRPLAINEITLLNKSSEAFEKFRHYSPSVVHDAVAAILNQITGISFHFVYNGATDQQRADNRAEWMAWCVSIYDGHNEGVCGN